MRGKIANPKSKRGAPIKVPGLAKDSTSFRVWTDRRCKHSNQDVPARIPRSDITPTAWNVHLIKCGREVSFGRVIPLGKRGNAEVPQSAALVWSSQLASGKIVRWDGSFESSDLGRKHEVSLEGSPRQVMETAEFSPIVS